MANVKITELTNLTDPSTTDVMPVVDVDADVTKKVSVGEIVGKITGDVEVATDGTATISELPVSKLADGTARQLLQTNAAGTGVEWTSNVDVPGTLDVTGVTTLDDALNVADLASLDGGIDVDGVFTVADATGNVSTSGTLGVTGQSTLASAAISDLTEDRVVIAGASGELEDSANLTFDGSELGITGTLDVSSDATVGGDLTVTGDLTVEGATTTLETQTVTVEDKTIELGVVDTPTDTTADGGGITLKGATDKTINWVDATDAWTFSEHIDIASSREFRIDGTKVLDATSLGSAVVSSSLTSVGTIATGTWEGTAIDAAYLDSTVVTTNDNGDVNIDNGGVFYDATNSRLGIGTTNPSSLLEVFSSGSGVETIAEFGNSVIDGGLSIQTNGNLDWGFNAKNSRNLTFSTNQLERVRIDSSGTFRVKGTGTAGVNDAVQLNGSAPADSLLLDASGRLLVGASSTSATATTVLQGNSSSSTTDGKLYIQRGVTSLGTNTRTGQINFADSASNVGAAIESWSDDAWTSGDYPGRLTFSTTADGASSPTERMRIDNAGTTTLTSAAATAPFIAKINTSEAARIDSSGRLLVGTSSWSGTSSPTTGLQFADNYTVAGPFSGGISSNGVLNNNGATAASTTVSLPNGNNFQNFIGTLYVALTLFNSATSYIAEYRVKIYNGSTASFTLVDSNDDSSTYAANITNTYDSSARVITVSASWTGSVASCLSATLIGAGAGGL